MIRIAFTTNNDFIQHCIVAIISILENTNEQIEFNFLYSNLSETNIKLINNTLKKYEYAFSNFIAIPKDYCMNFPIRHPFTEEAYYRFFLSSCLPYDRVIYLDCDLVVNTNIVELWNINIDNYYMAGVIDINNIEHCNRLELKEYVNAGVLLINAKKWREDNIEKQLVEYTINNSERIKWLDQDVLNTILQDKIKTLPYRYNIHVQDIYLANTPIDEKEYIKNEISTKAIIHYAGILKPWQFMHKRHTEEKYYYKYLRLSPFKNFEYKFKLLCILYCLIYISSKILPSENKIKIKIILLSFIKFSITIPLKLK